MHKLIVGRLLLIAVLLVFGAAACGEDTTLPENANAQKIPVHAKLSEFELFTDLSAVGAELAPAAGGVPYDLNTPLFSDYSLKYRVLHIPEDTQAHYREREVFEFPVGTIISKTFSFPADLREPTRDVRRIETRLLIHQPKGWTALSYVWNDKQTEATAAYGGQVSKISLVDKQGERREFNYAVPAKNQCGTCHHLYREVEKNGRTVRKQVILPIGPKARHINKQYEYPEGPANQIDYLAKAGMLTKLPFLASLTGGYPRLADADDQNASIDDRARAYLDANCGHCHTSGNSTGINSKLLLDAHESDWSNLGVCKTPGSAGKGGGGLRYDIVPGSPEESILWYRTASVDPGAMMPQLGRSLAHQEGVDLLYRWIAEMPARDCP